MANPARSTVGGEGDRLPRCSRKRARRGMKGKSAGPWGSEILRRFHCKRQAGEALADRERHRSLLGSVGRSDVDDRTEQRRYLPRVTRTCEGNRAASLPSARTRRFRVLNEGRCRSRADAVSLALSLRRPEACNVERDFGEGFDASIDFIAVHAEFEPMPCVEPTGAQRPRLVIDDPTEVNAAARYPALPRQN